jgi:4-carboxymuconolactone decarboxylase
MSETSELVGGRLTVLEPKSLETEQKNLYDFIDQEFVPWSEKANFAIKINDGRLVGPFNTFLYSPQVSTAFLKFMEAEGQFSTLNARVKEVVTITCGAFWKAKYELYAHSALARKAGLSEQAIRALATGQPPVELSADEMLAHYFTRQLITEHHVSQDLYSRAEAAFGKTELVNMTFLIGHYLLTSALLNTFETPAPDQQADITKKG